MFTVYHLTIIVVSTDWFATKTSAMKKAISNTLLWQHFWSICYAQLAILSWMKILKTAWSSSALWFCVIYNFCSSIPMRSLICWNEKTIIRRKQYQSELEYIQRWLYSITRVIPALSGNLLLLTIYLIMSSWFSSSDTSKIRQCVCTLFKMYKLDTQLLKTMDPSTAKIPRSIAKPIWKRLIGSIVRAKLASKTGPSTLIWIQTRFDSSKLIQKSLKMRFASLCRFINFRSVNMQMQCHEGL